jgi:hypothetical protein
MLAWIRKIPWFENPTCLKQTVERAWRRTLRRLANPERPLWFPGMAEERAPAALLPQNTSIPAE